jgi:hypothetical protein
MELDVSNNLHGLITFICLVLLPIVLFSFKHLNKVLYIIIVVHFFNVTYLIADSFYSRYKPVDPAYLHRLGVLVMIGALLYIIYRVFAERSMKFKANDKESSSDVITN